MHNADTRVYQLPTHDCPDHIRDALQGLEVRRESPFPSSSERGALEAAAASQKALVAGTRGLIIDVEVIDRPAHSKSIKSMAF